MWWSDTCERAAWACVVESFFNVIVVLWIVKGLPE